MKQAAQAGDTRTYQITVRPSDTATFKDTAHLQGGGAIHPVYATFAVARDAEWTCRLFVLDMKEPHEEGIGTMVSVYHKSPAHVGEVVTFIATLQSVERNTVICTYTAHAGDRLIAEGKQVQKILSRDTLNQVMQKR